MFTSDFTTAFDIYIEFAHLKISDVEKEQVNLPATKLGYIVNGCKAGGDVWKAGLSDTAEFDAIDAKAKVTLDKCPAKTLVKLLGDVKQAAAGESSLTPPLGPWGIRWRRLADPGTWAPDSGARVQTTSDPHQTTHLDRPSCTSRTSSASATSRKSPSSLRT